VAEGERLDLEPVDESEPQQRPLEPRRTTVVRQAPPDRIAGQPVVEGAVEHELDERLQVETLRRHAEDDPRCRRRVIADGRGMADGAVEADLIDAQAPPPRYADRQVAAGLADEAETFVAAAAARQLVA